MCVSGVGSDNPVTITFDKYQLGDAPVRIENWCEDVHLRLHQKGSNQVSVAFDERKSSSVLYLLPRHLRGLNITSQASVHLE